MKYNLTRSKQFKTDYKKLSQKDKELTLEVINKLVNGETLEAKYKVHSLKGSLKDFMDCHIKPDLVLIYRVFENDLIINAVRVGTHSDLFKK